MTWYACAHIRFGDESRMKRVPRNLDELYPFLLVNIGSGVSIIEVKDYYDFERVSGSALGGATYWGLCKVRCDLSGNSLLCSWSPSTRWAILHFKAAMSARTRYCFAAVLVSVCVSTTCRGCVRCDVQLLTKYVSFDESMEAARCGEVNRVNLSVGDIYGGDYVEIGLPANITAAFFGKATRAEDPMAGMQDADIAKALIQMIAQNVTQLAFLLAHMRKVSVYSDLHEKFHISCTSIVRCDQVLLLLGVFC